MDVERFEFKLAGMRKPDLFIVYPRQDDGALIAQGKRCIACVDPDGGGFVNWRGSHSKHFVHLNTVLGAEPMRADNPQWKEFAGLVREYQPSSGDLIGASPETGPVYIA